VPWTEAEAFAADDRCEAAVAAASRSVRGSIEVATAQSFLSVVRPKGRLWLRGRKAEGGVESLAHEPSVPARRQSRQDARRSFQESVLSLVRKWCAQGDLR